MNAGAASKHLIGGYLALALSSVLGGQTLIAQTDTKGIEYFESHIRPLFLDHCVTCHDKKKKKGGLRLDTLAGIAKGGESGPITLAGHPERSLIIKAIQRKDPDLKMPPKKPLSPQQIALIIQWVKFGSPLPEFKLPASAKSSKSYDWAHWQSFWSFKPIDNPKPPITENPAWIRNPIDAFSLAAMQKHGLAPVASADRATLIRRASFDLLGLPPTPQQIKAFLADRSPDAYEKLIDRMLSSPHYGQRWGRHWLDIVRYVQGAIQFKGMERIKGAQLYRQYVVRAFNQDKSYNRFIIEQLAGDLLPLPSADHPNARQQTLDQIVAPTFLSIGPWFDQCTDPNQLRLEMIEDMINVTGKSFLGLSISCARCHDHKFDPIPTQDYYALAGVFRSTEIMQRFSQYWRKGRVRMLKPLATPQESLINQRIEQTIALLKERKHQLLGIQLRKLLPTWRANEAKYRKFAKLAPQINARRYEAAGFFGLSNLLLVDAKINGVKRQILETRLPYDQWVKYKIPVSQPGKYTIEAQYAAGQNVPIAIKIGGMPLGKDVTLPDTGSWEMTHRRWHVIGTYELRVGTHTLSIERKRGPFPRFIAIRVYRADADRDKKIISKAYANLLHPQVFMNFVKDPAHPYPSTGDMDRFVDRKLQQEVTRIQERIDQLKKAITPYELTISVADAMKPTDMPVHIRGSTYSTSKEQVVRGAPRLFDHLIQKRDIPADQSGRLQLARWITAKTNPLTARVMVNRIWAWHFGRGIVGTTSDFGSQGEKPTHPQLLDWLASKFIENNWSIKSMHRLIMTSNTYRAGSVIHKGNAAIDPQAKYFWRFNRKRLEVEALYDAMICTAGKLRRQTRGPLNPDQSKDRALYILTSGRSPKGLGIEIRKMFTLFDYDDSGAMIHLRKVSTTPGQALFWLNSPLVKYYAGLFAKQILGDSTLATDEKRLHRAYMGALGRPPTKAESDRMLEFLTRATANSGPNTEPGATGDPKAAALAWASICQALYGSNEFRYID